ncbi:DNA polymerase III subunit gamma/tau [Paraprevotella xylaniphila]|jgi:DNA polymerase-3 subunit gamma/tau|uniref:DNA polymerase III subunit gamma/tau n=1 Tax=Paraprevotella xylaniphila TaxID=454155 RepID=UPI00266D1395|nr:DNA polymerase III subunit gamma/tau [Paraprevotella xylaniphila]
MGEYIVSARKYRPSAFDAVVGQEALTTTLKNAIAAGKLAHAYLFCGPRGVGKTTCARIFAKTINCLHPSGNGEACDECESCKAFNEQRSLNIHELDAASNNSVEEIRALIEKVRIPPQVGRYKVFIIDEVHMLSTAAFNAFLKTLEEPPSYVIFILATTEKHKILPTILSRCQVYDFNRMSVQAIVNHLKFVADKEGYAYEPEALNIIAQKADGGMRDALSIFDQTVSFTGGNLTYKKVIENLNVLDYEYYFRLTDHFLKNEAAQCMLVFNEILEKGFEGSHFITGLASHLRDLLVSHDAVTLPLLEVSDSIRAHYQEQSQRCTPKFLYRAIKLCSDCDLNYRASKNKRLLVEITLIQLSQLTLEDDSAGSGRSPEKSLKPLFAQPAGTVQPTTTPVNPQKPQAPVEKVASAVQDRTESYETRKSPLPDTETTERRPPKVKLGSFGPSISRLKQEIGNPADTSQPTANQVTTPAAAQALKEEENYPVTGDNIRFCWNEFINLLPQEETAIAQRMKVIQPKLLKDATFEVLVDNEQVKFYMEQIARRIETHMRKQLHNRNITMTVRIAEPTEVTRITSKPQQYQAMSKRNPALQKLKETFGLELA